MSDEYARGIAFLVIGSGYSERRESRMQVITMTYRRQLHDVWGKLSQPRVDALTHTYSGRQGIRMRTPNGERCGVDILSAHAFPNLSLSERIAEGIPDFLEGE